MAEGGTLKVALDLHPLGIVELSGLVARVEEMRDDEWPGYLLGVNKRAGSLGGATPPF